jgi:hypothetical protein
VDRHSRPAPPYGSATKTPANLKMTPYPLGRQAVGTDTGCHAGSVAFDIPAAEKADTLQVKYIGSTSLVWVVRPAAQ